MFWYVDVKNNLEKQLRNLKILVIALQFKRYLQASLLHTGGWLNACAKVGDNSAMIVD